jgi:predicted amidohydrolase YtcJ
MRKLFINASFHLMTNREDTGVAIQVENGIITKIYHDKPLVMLDYEIVDLEGRHVYPGFIDTHAHCFEGGLYSQSLDLSKVHTLKQTLELIDAYYTSNKAEKAYQLDAFRFDENNIDAERFPTMKELDSVCPDIPLVLRRIDGHSSVVNTAAWKIFTENNQRYLNGSEDKQDADFVLRGSLNDKLVHWFHENCSDETILNSYARASEIALANGITTIHTMVGDADDSIMHYRFLQENLSKFQVNFIAYPQSFNIKAALDEGAERIGGCILADGSLGSYTAALRLPYNGKPDNSGILNHSNEFWQRFITEAVVNNLQVAVHCIGDRAIKQINDIYLNLKSKNNQDLRHELIHCELTPDDLVSEIAESGAFAVMQPAFDLYWGCNGGYYERALGVARKKQMNRFNTLKSKGITITGGSDWYITELDALQGIYAATHHNNPEERLDWFDAVKMYTANAASLSHDENKLGFLKAGYWADFITLEHEISSNTLNKGNNVMATYKNGMLVYNK